MRRIGLKQASGPGLLGVISALAVAVATPMAVAQSVAQSASQSAGPTAAAPASADTAASAPSASVAQPVIANAPVVAPVQAPALVPAGAPAAAATSAATPQKIGSGGPVRGVTTRYSHRKREGIVNTGVATAPVAGATPGQSEITCRAGCDQVPGEIVHVQPKPQVKAPVEDAEEADAETPAKPKVAAVLLCVAGCYEQPATFAGIPSEIESGYMTTQGKMPVAKATSGEWMVRINRERSAPAHK